MAPGRMATHPSTIGEDMEYAIGAGLALIVGAFATAARFERDRAFYPTVLVVIASYYDLFAIMAGSTQALGLETVGLFALLIAAVVGFRSSLWIVVAALVAHGVFDLIHAGIIANPGVPAWWPMFCLTYDVMAAGYLGWRLLRARRGPCAFQPPMGVSPAHADR